MGSLPDGRFTSLPSTDTPVAIVTAAGRGISAVIARRQNGHRLGLLSDGGGAKTLAEELGGEVVVAVLGQSSTRVR